ncbi:kinesin-like protein KIF3B isoform X2 [Thrips palmi]|nr:kinesin-like protein KIF3B isoform X2 [Thrips palmi]
MTSTTNTTMEKNTKPVKKESVQVVVRCRPMNDRETREGHERVVDMFPTRGVVEIRNPREESRESIKTFTFDAVYDWTSKQQDLYDETIRPLVSSVLDGFNGTIFAYGQTGTGKTYTMEGCKSEPDSKGIIPKSFDQIFSHIARQVNMQYLVRASYLEIYQEEIRDLLDRDQNKRHDLREKPDTGVYVKDLQSFVCKSVKEIEQVMTVGNQNRTIGATNMNEHSSRSHAIFMITIEMSQTSEDGKNQIRVGKLNLVDLAGSERQSKTGASGERLKEASKINLSLSALGNVISALVDGKSQHVPYRDSKLTRLLQDSLGGNSKTIMVANIGPASYNYDESLTTLRYANRAKNIKNKPRVNEDPKDALLRQYQEEIAKLKNILAERAAQRSQTLSGKKKKKKKKDKDADDSEGSDEESSRTEEDLLKAQEAQLDQKKEKILSNKNAISEEEKARLLKELDDKRALLAQEKAYAEQLATKIKSMESKLLCGGKNIIDHTNEQQRALEQQRAEIVERKRREIEMKQKLDAQEEEAMEIRETYTNLQQEVEIKTKKLKKMFAKLQLVKQEIQDVTEEFNRDRRELEATRNELLKDLKLQYLIIDNFIPPEEKERLIARSRYDDEEDCWKSDPPPAEQLPLFRRPVSVAGMRRPISEYARVASKVGVSHRFCGENIIRLELDPHPRTTDDYTGPAVAPGIMSVLEAALKKEDDLDVDASAAGRHFRIRSGRPLPPSMALNTGIPISAVSKSAISGTASVGNKKVVYPKARGLVPK